MVVEVDGALDQAQAEDADAEVEIGLRAVDGGGHVMEAFEERHVDDRPVVELSV